MNDIAISVKGLGKRYRLHHSEGAAGGYRTLRDEVMRLPSRLRNAMRPAAEVDDFWALRDVSFDVKRGEVLGVIGRNGAGKSTLLKILSRIVEPTEGTVDIYGRVGSLLEVGTGFHPELTGRENIFLSGAILGMKRPEIRARFDEIVAFAGVELFVDEAVKHYSSGMYARLAFAVAAHLETEILLIDEVLAVGDTEFKQRCGMKMRQLVGSEGRAIILISHEPALIRSLCSRAIHVDKGRLQNDGLPDQVLTRYHLERKSASGLIVQGIKQVADGIRIDSIKVGGSEERRLVIASDAEHIDVVLEGAIQRVVRMELEVRLYDRDGNTLAFFSPGHDSGLVAVRNPGAFRLAHRIKIPRLLRGAYSLRIGVVDPNFTGWFDLPDAVQLEVEGATTRLGMLSAGSHCGWMMLSGEEVSPTGGLEDPR
ncbi:MAG: ABC transporter ATP-binding protein [Opitutaceae bacterium]|jgi:lipopolysaccharide transport system ATP-binding protein